MDVLAYTYEADHHCEECTLERFQRNEQGDIVGTDSEGNEIGVVFSTDEWYNIGEEGGQFLACGDCGKELDFYED